MRSFFLVVLTFGMVLGVTAVLLAQESTAPVGVTQPEAPPTPVTTPEKPSVVPEQPATEPSEQEPASATEAEPAPEQQPAETAGQETAPVEVPPVEPAATPEVTPPAEQPEASAPPVTPAPQVVPMRPVTPAPQAVPQRQMMPGQPVSPSGPSAQGAPGEAQPSVAPVAGGPAAFPAASEGNMISLNFSGPVELPAFLDFVRQKTGKNFIYDAQTFQGRVTLLPSQQIPESRLFTLLESILAFDGFVMLPTTGNWIEIHKIQDVPKKPSPLLTPEEFEATGETDALVTIVYKLKYLSAMDVQTQIMPMATSQGTIIVLARSNILLMTDYSSNLRRLMTLLPVIDSKYSIPQLRIFQLMNVSAQDLSQQILRVVRNREAGMGAMQPGQSANVEFDPGTNKLIVTAMEDEMSIIDQLIKELDVPSQKTGRNIRIYALRNATVKEIAPTLEQLTNQMPSGVRATPPGARPGPQGGAPQMVSSAMGAIGEVQVKIIGDETTNSIIVLGPPDIQADIKALIDELDKRKAQVLIEALIVQVTGGRNFDVGAELEAFGQGAPKGVGYTAFGMSTIDPKTGARTISTDGTGLGVTGALINDDQVPIIVHALMTDRGGQVISRPRLLVSDNIKAEFKSIDEQPTTATNSLTSTTSTTSFSGYVPAGTDLTIKPHISPTAPEEGQIDYLTLEMILEVSQFTAAGSAGSSVPPPKRTDKIDSSVQVPDTSTIVIGGLSGHHMTSTVNKVPILGDIPILGWLFSRTNTTRDDTTEYIFIKARIARAVDFTDLLKMSKGPQKESEALQQKCAQGAPSNMLNDAIDQPEPAGTTK